MDQFDLIDYLNAYSTRYFQALLLLVIKHLARRLFELVKHEIKPPGLGLVEVRVSYVELVVFNEEFTFCPQLWNKHL